MVRWDVFQLLAQRVVLQLLAWLAAAAGVLATVVSQDWFGRLIGRRWSLGGQCSILVGLAFLAVIDSLYLGLLQLSTIFSQVLFH